MTISRRHIAAIAALTLATLTGTTIPSVPIATAARARVGQGTLARQPIPRAFALGDSVMLGAAPDLQHLGISVDAVESRQFFQGVDILRWMRADGRLPGTVVVDLGTNGPITSDLFDSMMTVLRGLPLVIFVTVKEPRWWEGEVNSTIRAGVARWPHTRLADWRSDAGSHPEWFWDDGIHLRPEGAIAYTQLIAATLTRNPSHLHPSRNRRGFGYCMASHPME